MMYLSIYSRQKTVLPRMPLLSNLHERSITNQGVRLTYGDRLSP